MHDYIIQEAFKATIKFCYMPVRIPHALKFLRDAIFGDNQNPAVLYLKIICYEPLSSIQIKNFED